MNHRSPLDPPKPDAATLRPPRSSRRRYLKFVKDYKERRLDEISEGDEEEDKVGREQSREEASHGAGGVWTKAGEAARVSAGIPALALAASVSPWRRWLRLALLAAGIGNGRAAVHAVHHRSRAAEYRPGLSHAPGLPAIAGGAVPGGGHRLARYRRRQGLSPAAAEYARDAVAAASRCSIGCCTCRCRSCGT